MTALRGPSVGSWVIDDGSDRVGENSAAADGVRGGSISTIAGAASDVSFTGMTGICVVFGRRARALAVSTEALLRVPVGFFPTTTFRGEALTFSAHVVSYYMIRGWTVLANSLSPRTLRSLFPIVDSGFSGDMGSFPG